jgi:ssDNA-binding Zn-finger/Zn-ribbon topoisomerase 1
VSESNETPLPTTEVKCPKCGGQKLHLEWTEIFRNEAPIVGYIKSKEGSLAVVINYEKADGDWRDTDEEHADLFCTTCRHHWPVPIDVGTRDLAEIPGGIEMVHIMEP